ncbi:hypothetical protein AV926_18435 [Myroides marinus]|uniref:Uncharacterized protein n=2 Tax=Myroides marinus TaxID=703342 RepID=A0A165Q1R1_9FLAO|nr:hypothetical protein AV926_18435 [Myroides marinus]
MVRIRTKQIILYLIGVLLLVFGYPDFWNKVIDYHRLKEEIKRSTQEAEEAISQPFEVQELVYDSNSKRWKNKQHYFQVIHLGKVNFKSKQKVNINTIETNDDENASDSF